MMMLRKKAEALRPINTIRVFILFSAVMLLLAGFAGADDFSPADRQSINDPHVPTTPGPWFEGWYFRVSDADGSGSVAVIVASHLPKGETYTPGMALPGYINVLISEGDGAPTRSFTAFPQETRSLVAGEPVSRNPDFSTDSNFEWIAEGYGSVTEDSVNLNIPGTVDVRIETFDRIPWDRRFPAAGPEGLLMFLPVPLHWYIHSLGSEATYSYTLSDAVPSRTVSGEGYAHLEKNWQKEFPLGWVWVQGIAEDNCVQVVISLARVALDEETTIMPWIAGYRSEGLQWDFRFHLPDAALTLEMDACAGTLSMTARDLFRTLRVEAAAPPDSFGDVSIPTENGFVPQSGKESFSATVTVSAFWHLPVLEALGIEWLIEEQVFYNAALEFGNGYACYDR